VTWKYCDGVASSSQGTRISARDLEGIDDEQLSLLRAHLAKAVSRKRALHSKQRELRERSNAADAQLVDIYTAPFAAHSVAPDLVASNQNAPSSLQAGPFAPVATPPVRSPNAMVPHSSLNRFGSFQDDSQRPLSSYLAMQGLSLPDIVRYCDVEGGLVNVASRMARHVWTRKALKADLMGVPESEICWFLLMPYEVAPGVPISLSETLCSTECLGSAMVRGYSNFLDAAFLKARLDVINGAHMFTCLPASAF
jgi:hypothetical protein